jgi:hypothetical protein
MDNRKHPAQRLGRRLQLIGTLQCPYAGPLQQIFSVMGITGQP